MRDKFTRYTPYQKLKQIDSEVIDFSDVISVLKDTFKATSFEEKTWETYSKYLISWFNFAELDIMAHFVENKSGRRNLRSRIQSNTNFLPDKRPSSIIKVFNELITESQNEDFETIKNTLYQLKCLGLIEYHNKKINLTEKGKLIKDKFGTSEYEKMIAIEAIKTTKIAQASKYLFDNPACSRNEFEEGISHILNINGSKEYRIRSRNILYSWAKFVNEHLNNSDNASDEIANI